MDTKRTAAKSVDEYINSLPDAPRGTLGKVRKAIKAAVPGAAEVISYQIPTYKYNGQPFAALAAFKEHCSYFTTSHSVMKTFKKELKPYYTSGVTIRFPVDKPLPAVLVKKLVKAKIKENELKIKKKQLLKQKINK